VTTTGVIDTPVSKELVRMDSRQIALACDREIMRLEENARDMRSKAQELYNEADVLCDEANRLKRAKDSINSTAPIESR
jgi:hypothetical protein